MIPILYSATEVDFITNGLGALSDAASCVVTEERNGSYELEMEYPIDGRHYNDISLDSIIYAQPADGKEPQPFQVYKISTPIDDLVTISAQHISYRLSFVPVSPLTAMGANNALTSFKTNSIIEHPFEVFTDMGNTTSQYSRAVPSSFRECIGGTDGSFLDVFGGEIEWDKFLVKIYQHRGADNGVRIAYSKNLTDFKNEEANDSVITAIYPYWINSDTLEMVTCGVVYAIEDFGYTPVPTGETTPTWLADTYYRIKTTGYYQNDEVWAPHWAENTYYAVKQTGYYNIEDDSVPTWIEDTYYSALPYGFFNVTGDVAPDFAYDTYYENTGSLFVQVTEETQPEWKVDTYYKNDGTSADPYYILTIEQPSDWETNYNDYFINEGTTFALLTSKPYNWSEEYMNYYIYISPEYALTTIEPANWNTEYKGYYVYYKKDDANPIYTLTTSEPYDWETKYNDYFVYYEQRDGVTDYVITTSQPVDWDVNYTNYFTYWEIKHNDKHPFSRVVSMDFSSDFDEQPTEKQLKKYASLYINLTSLTDNSIHLDVSFVALWQTEEYKNIAALERVNLCDIVTVDLQVKESINTVKLKVIKTEYDVLAERYTKIELGNSTSSLSTTISSMNDTFVDMISETVSSLQNAIAHQVKIMNGGLGGNVIINYNSEGRPCEITIGNTDNISTMTECLRINYKGIGFSKTGYDGTYTSVWGLNGEFDAQCVKAGTIDGGAIKADTIQASSFTTAAKESLLSDVNESISTLQNGLSDLADISGWIHVEDGHLYIGDANSTIVIVQGSYLDIDGKTYQKISFVDKSTYPPTELAYISNNRFYTNELMLGGYKVVASTNDREGVSFRWAENISESN